MALRASKEIQQASKIHTTGPAKKGQAPDYKSYPRFEKIALPESEPRGDISALVQARKSSRTFSREPITTQSLSALLKHSCGIVRKEKDWNVRAQPSGGAKFPIEVYPLVIRGSADVPAGLYHYNVQEHVLDTLWRRPFSASDIRKLFTYEWTRDASVVLLMTAVFHRTQAKYGERGYRYVYLEAGHIGQNIYLNAAALDLRCCGLGGTRDEELETLLDIDGKTEAIVYAVALG